jgi:CTP synthase
VHQPHYIFVTGGVVSSLGKGIVTAALGTILEGRGLSIRFLKLDPYLNIDPGTLSPYQHGEVFVTEDGTEADLDLGHYERFTRVKTTCHDNYTAGKIYASILHKERQGDYLGGTVQVIPHVTDAIKQVMQRSTATSDIALVEIGGTVGDIESLPFLEAIRQMRIEVGPARTYFIHLTWVPYIRTAGEIKTKPTQHSTKELRSIGIQPDILICRSEDHLPDSARHKIALFSNLSSGAVISLPDVDNIYTIPRLLQRQGVDTRIIDQLQIQAPPPHLNEWESMLSAQKNHVDAVNIAIVGKYTELADAYKSVTEALIHAGIKTHTRVHIQYIDAENVSLSDSHALDAIFHSVDAILVPGGFGTRGIEGKIAAAHYAREKQIPYFGICLGMQTAVIEFARHHAKLMHAHSTECDPNTPYPVIALVTEWKTPQAQIEKRTHQSALGGTMRLGSQTCHLQIGSQIAKLYGQTVITERHRHRYEVNAELVPLLEKAGLRVTGHSIDGLIETIELPEHPWFIGCQFHPEFTSNPREGHPLFISFIKAAKNRSDSN